MLAPVLPATAAKAAEFLDLGDASWAQLREPLPAGHRIRPYQHLMQRVDPKQIDALFEPPAEPPRRRWRTADAAQAAASRGQAAARR